MAPASQFGPITETDETAPRQAIEIGFVDSAGKLQPGQVDGSGNIKVSVTGAGSGGTSSVDESTFAPGVSAGTPAMGAYEASPTPLADSQLGIIALDENRNVKVNIVAGSSGNGAAGPTGNPVPAQADYQGFQNPSGDLEGVASENFDYDTGGGSQAQSAYGIVTPASGGPLPVPGGHGTAAGALRVELPTDGTGVIATVGAVTAITNPLPAGTNVLGHVITDTGSTTVVTGTVAVSGPLTDTQLRATPVPISGTVTATVTGVATAANQTNASQKTQIVDGSGNVIGATSNALDINIKSGNPTTIAVTQATAASLNATVVGAGSAGTANAGVVTVQGIASMTPLLVTPAANSAINLAQVNGAAVNVGAGNAGTGTPRVSISTDDVNLAAINAVSGVTSGAAITTDIDGTLQRYLRGLIKGFITVGTFFAVSPDTSDTIYIGTTALPIKFAKIAASSSGDNTVVAAVTSKKIRVLAYNFIANGTVNAKWQSGAAGTDLTGLKYCVANMGICAPYNPKGWLETASGVLLNLNLSGSIAVGGELTYIEVP